MGRPVPLNRRLLVSSSSEQAADPLLHLEQAPACPGTSEHSRLPRARSSLP
jgi:hypothetical protein